MRAILRTGFGGPEVLEIREIPEPEPKAGHAVIEVKAFGINHAEMHMRKGEWAEIADVSGIECVGLIKSCPGGEFAIGTKAAALMGGLGRTINGSYAEFTRAPVSNVAAIESDLSWADIAAIPETYATAWTCLFRNLEIAGGQTLVIRGATSSFGQAAVNMAVNTGARVIATTRNRERFGLLEGLGVERGSQRPSGSTRCSTWWGTARSSTLSPCSAAVGGPVWPGGWVASRRSQTSTRSCRWRAASTLRSLAASCSGRRGSRCRTFRCRRLRATWRPAGTRRNRLGYFGSKTSARLTG